ncbi:winged helix-turn-helix transcriptional regulator [Amycolatopsis roodepoortensis]|uniref:DNA-binding HxlR family transcriptional regulator n=1 Tax=Amycolatopsis roodepoortensis TaxID=700274 RepID=A0ABR9LFB8_9PSEU|nr:winged helix-turn-helix transcriptional regulator [Amycolatopsis roodepoortensis]MBE1579232.1 DNA-binding HxlR family transcriptional regulator [Amycolatopsis roodepoortensis]
MTEATAHRVRPAGDPLRRALELLGDQWTLLILQSLFLRFRRYEELRLRLGISPTALSGRLRAMVEADVLVRTPYRDARRTRHEYRLTERGLELWPLLISIWAWEREWVEGRRAVLPTLIHLDCELATSAPLGCASCERRVDARDVRARRLDDTGVVEATASKRFRRKDADSLAGDPLMFFPDTMELLGDRWSTGLVVSALLGARHFSEFERELGIGPSVLSGRLSKLVDVGVLRTGTAKTRADAHDYRLTAKGLAFFPALAIIAEWSRGFEVPGQEPDITLDHVDCGDRLKPILLCDHCWRPLLRNRVRFGGPVQLPTPPR